MQYYPYSKAVFPIFYPQLKDKFYSADEATRNRELRALAAAGKDYPRAIKRLLTLTQDGLPSEAPADIVAQPVYEWLLKTPTSE